MEIKHTRMGLIQTKKRIKLASKGYKLLKDKYNALIVLFFKKFNEVEELRKTMEPTLKGASFELNCAIAFLGQANIDKYNMNLTNNSKIQITDDIVMGKPTKKIFTTNQDKQLPSTTSPMLAIAHKNLSSLHKNFVQLFNEQLKLNSLARDIAKTKKKVNALEKITLPFLKTTKEKISMKLEERERETFNMLKIVKKRKKEEKTAK